MDTTPVDLKVVWVDCMIGKNGPPHRTDEYDVMDKGSLVVRRGQYFTIGIVFNKPYDKKKDDLKLVFTTGLYRFYFHNQRKMLI